MEDLLWQQEKEVAEKSQEQAKLEIRNLVEDKVKGEVDDEKTNNGNVTNVGLHYGKCNRRND